MSAPGHLKIACKNCNGHIEFPEAMHGQAFDCPHCGLSVMLVLPGYNKSKDAPPVICNPVPDEPPEPCGLLPVLADEALCRTEVRSSDGTRYYTVNLLDYTCSCPSFVNDHANAPLRDYGRMCKHICASLNHKKILPLLDPICKAMVASGYGVYQGRFGHDNNGNLIYITGVSPSGWLNVYALKRVNGKTYYQFGYSVTEQRWSFGQSPNVDERMLIAQRKSPSSPTGVMGAFWPFLKRVLLGFGTIILFLLSLVLNVFGAILVALLKPTKRRRKHRL